MTEAAVALGLTVDAVRSRIKRGTMDHVRAGGRVYVLLGDDEARPGHGQDTHQGGDQGTTAPEDRTAELIATLQEQLQAERQAHAEARRIIAGLVERIPALGPPESPETPSDPTPKSPGPPEPETPRVVASPVSHSRLGMSARVLVLGAVVTLLVLASLSWQFFSLGSWLYTKPFLFIGGSLSTLLLFGLCAGYTKSPSFPWFSWPHRWLRRSGRSVLVIAIFAAGIPAAAGLIIGYSVETGVKAFFEELSAEFLSGLLVIIGLYVGIPSSAFTSGAFLGNALRRFGVLGMPKEPPQGAEEGDREEEVWSPRKEAQWGLAGSIIVALIGAVASVVAATVGQ